MPGVLTVSLPAGTGAPVQMSVPTVAVEVGFANAPLTQLSAITWTDITQYVKSFSTHIGRQHELGRVEAGTCSIVIDNKDGRFDPTNTASPYWPNVIPMRRIRIRASWGATTYPVFCGFVDSWPLQWPSVANAYVHLTASDGFKPSNLKKLLNAYPAEVLKDSPAGYWRFQEKVATQPALDFSGHAANGAYFNSPTLGQASAVADSGDSSFGLAGLGEYVALPTSVSVVGTGPFSVAGWFRTAPTYNTWTLATQQPAGDQFNGWSAFGDATFLSFTTMQSGLSTSFVTAGALGQADGNWHFLVCVRESDGTLRLYLDGVQVAVRAAAPLRSMPAVPITVGGGWNGGVDEFAVYPTTALSAARVAALWAARTAWASQLTGTRVATALDVLGWPTADRSIEAGASTMPAESTPGTVLQVLTDAAVAENGLVFQAPDGTMTFLQRSHVVSNARSTVSQATFGDGPGELPYLLNGLQPNMDDLDIYNQAIVNRLGGPIMRALDATSEAQYGSRVLSETDLKISLDTEAQDRANYQVSRHKDPALRIRSFSITPSQSDPGALYPQALGRQLWDRITFKRRAPGAGTFTQDSVIEGISHSFDMHTAWTTTYALSPTDTQPYLILDDAVHGQLDSNKLFY